MVTMKLKLQKPPPAAGGEILKSGPHDVLCGRGNRINGYKGNRLFQQVVKRTRLNTSLLQRAISVLLLRI